MNYRNQSLDFIKQNSEINKKFENKFKTYINKKYNIKIISQDNIYSHLDFTYHNINIEYKGIYYKLNKDNTTALKCGNNEIKIKDVMIGVDKIEHYKKLYNENNRLTFLIFYGFYTVIKNEVKNICYRYIDITDILFNINEKYNIRSWLNKEHYLITISDLKETNENTFNIYSSSSPSINVSS